jgi:hypothetical protein
VEQDSVKIPGGYWVPNCAKPTDVFLCRQKDPAADPTAGGGVPTPAPSSGDFTSYDKCGDEGDAAANTGGSYTKQVDKGQCLGTKLAPLDPASQCCDRPLRPGICVPGQSISTDTVVSHKCEKRWMFDRIQDFRVQCNAAVGASGTDYGAAYFLSAKSRLQIDKVTHEQTIIDANVLCWPTVCSASDLQNHLASRAAECTKNFMSTCSYAARPIECNRPDAGSAACTAKATVGVAQWNNPTDPARQWGYTLCDNIMDGENGLKDCVYTVGSLPPRLVTVKEATPTPVPMPSPHPCDSGTHLCDTGVGGECNKLVGLGPVTWTCDCKAGFYCSAGCAVPHGGHACTALAPTPADSSGSELPLALGLALGLPVSALIAHKLRDRGAGGAALTVPRLPPTSNPPPGTRPTGEIEIEMGANPMVRSNPVTAGADVL